MRDITDKQQEEGIELCITLRRLADDLNGRVFISGAESIEELGKNRDIIEKSILKLAEIIMGEDGVKEVEIDKDNEIANFLR